ncbi:NADH oxidase [Clostridioides difficile]|nr:NADH oxidase [Clostridioides difficile]
MCYYLCICLRFKPVSYTHLTLPTTPYVDKSGGALAIKKQYAKEVLDSVRKAVGPGFPIEFRMSGSELFEGGYNLDYGIEIAKLLEFFVFKQKAAYDIMPSLVGSEMCIRDRYLSTKCAITSVSV